LSQLELPSPEPGAFTVVVYRESPAGIEFLLLEEQAGWVLPGGSCRLAESVDHAARRAVREQTGLDLAVSEVESAGSGGAFFLAQLADTWGLSQPDSAATYRWFGLGQVRALDLGPDGRCVERVAVYLE
jgi:8-oxo-dGTP pyrophosphatase MutT (NUDIX family)